jgi:hypothetical protein
MISMIIAAWIAIDNRGAATKVAKRILERLTELETDPRPFEAKNQGSNRPFLNCLTMH